MKLEELYADPTKQWNNTYQEIELGAVTADAAPVYALDDSFLVPANVAYVIDVNGKRVEYVIIKAQEKDVNKQQVFTAGQDPQNLYFTREIKETENIVGGTLFLPGYVMPDLPTDENSLVPAPDANWAVYATASGIAENDITYEDKAANLNAKANNLYRLMAIRSTRGTYGNSRKSKYNVPKIGQRHR
jgi:hypothetical protein